MTGNDLKELRTGLRLTVDRLADECGISRPYLSLMETREDGQAPIPDRHIDVILAGLERLGVGAESSVVGTRHRIQALRRTEALRATEAPEAE